MSRSRTKEITAAVKMLKTALNSLIKHDEGNDVKK